MLYLIYILFRIAVFIVSLIPFSALYVISNGLAFLLKKIVKYRKKVVYNNLKKCFPDKSTTEINSIANKFYLNLSDVILESIKGFTMSEKELHKRYNFINREVINQYFEKNQKVVCVSAHFSNWEWGVLIMGKQFNHKTFGVYKPLSNKYIDAYIKRKRKKLGMGLLHMEHTIKGMRASYDKPPVFILIADQSPTGIKKALWVDFFGHKTACAPGPEKASMLFKTPVVFILPVRLKRGYYEVKTELITHNAAAMAPNQITQEYMSKLESHIRQSPSDWLWSHRRWKHKYEEQAT